MNFSSVLLVTVGWLLVYKRLSHGFQMAFNSFNSFNGIKRNQGGMPP
jgi:hypothetical protein